jgi:hypothetical protein
MDSKFRNMKQVPRTLRPDTKYLEKWDKTVDMVHWESNSLIKRHPHIDPDKIIAKCSLSEFPANAITVRLRSQRMMEVGVYFYGKKENRTWNGRSYCYIDKKLRVTLPYTRTEPYCGPCDENGRPCLTYLADAPEYTPYGFVFNGELPENVDTEGLKIALDYIADTINEIE